MIVFVFGVAVLSTEGVSQALSPETLISQERYISKHKAAKIVQSLVLFVLVSDKSAQIRRGTSLVHIPCSVRLATKPSG